MKKAILIWFVIQLTVSAFASGRVTVDQLNRVVVSSHGKPDAKIAERLFGLELTERLSAAKLAALEGALPGPNSRRALVALADQATFLDPPPAEIPNQPAPSLEQQREIMARAIDYVKTTLHRLPNLFADRDTIRFEDTPAVLQGGGISAPSGTFVPSQPLHPTSRSTQTVLYRDGQEIVQTAEEEQRTSASEMPDLTTFGEFGPILSTVFGDIPRGSLAWSHWEQGSAKPVTVFRLEVPRGASHYQVKFCCISGRVFQQFPAYHGEITIDPADGTILRLALIADLSKDDPITKANLMVEYGPVELGKRAYFCPLKSISLSVAPVQLNRKKSLSGAVVPTTRGAVQIEVQDNSAADAPLQTMLNEVVFDQYHLFHSEARILTANSSEPASTPDAAANAAFAPDLSSAATPREQAALTNENPVPAASTAGTVARTDDAIPAVPRSTALPPATVPSAVPSTPEISVAAPADLPQTPAVPAARSTEPGFSLHVSTRLVDIGVTAYDRKGQPITDLTREDFVVYDNDKTESPFIQPRKHRIFGSADLRNRGPAGSVFQSPRRDGQRTTCRHIHPGKLDHCPPRRDQLELWRFHPCPRADPQFFGPASLFRTGRPLRSGRLRIPCDGRRNDEPCRPEFRAAWVDAECPGSRPRAGRGDAQSAGV